MTLKASVLFALRMLKPRNGLTTSAGRSLVGAVFCIGLSLIPLVVVLTVSDGMIQGITSRIIELSSYHMQISVRNTSVTATSPQNFSALLEIVAAVPGVTGVFPEQQGIALAAGSSGRTGATVRAVPPETFSGKTSFSRLFSVSEGTLSLSGSRSALVGTKVAEALQLKAGDTVRLVTFRESAGGRLVPRMTPFTVEGIISSGYQELDALWVFIPFEAGKNILSGEQSSLCVGVVTEDAFSDSLYTIAAAVRQVLPAGCTLRLWNEMNRTQYENFASTRMMLVFIMFLIVLVASVNVSSALVMLSMERRREIAILKSIGGTSGGIVTSFLLTGFCTGAAGVLLGMPLGILCAVNVNRIIVLLEHIVNIFAQIWYSIQDLLSISAESFVPVRLLDPAYYLDQIPVVLPFTELWYIAAGTLMLSVLVSVLPSIRAGAEKPVETLRKL